MIIEGKVDEAGAVVATGIDKTYLVEADIGGVAAAKALGILLADSADRQADV